MMPRESVLDWVLATESGHEAALGGEFDWLPAKRTQQPASTLRKRRKLLLFSNRADEFFEPALFIDSAVIPFIRGSRRPPFRSSHLPRIAKLVEPKAAVAAKGIETIKPLDRPTVDGRREPFRFAFVNSSHRRLACFSTDVPERTSSARSGTLGPRTVLVRTDPDRH